MPLQFVVGEELAELREEETRPGRWHLAWGHRCGLQTVDGVAIQVTGGPVGLRYCIWCVHGAVYLTAAFHSPCVRAVLLGDKAPLMGGGVVVDAGPGVGFGVVDKPEPGQKVTVHGGITMHVQACVTSVAKGIEVSALLAEVTVANVVSGVQRPDTNSGCKKPRVKSAVGERPLQLE